ncbi:hypothetical protein GGX14DRAFT_453204 [Mycena pura]|uniref:Uncharacterized protein n=1 Tax=Mycena pura TaxID=153505 RepID=A0AAD6VGJ2_9AGAR|nr:hypothetical protein GGX14DRAFT_453204 [Mycena pura]
MPVSFNVADHPANPVNLTAAQIDGISPEMILRKACAHQYRSAGEILGSSFNTYEAPPSLRKRLSKLNPFTKRKEPPSAASADPPMVSNVIPTPNGFVHTVLSAYNKHHNLIIRPDDVWLAILTQFNFFVNASAERLRASFVAHAGKETLSVERQADRYTMNFADMAREMAGLLGKVVVDPTLRAWALPNFSTTTSCDTTVGAIIMMSTLKSYFEYHFTSIECGIPRVTLDGTKADWVALLERLEKLQEYGMETIAWYHLLFPVISHFVSAFDAPDASANVTFWQKVAHFESGGSGPSYYSGWICAFCVFNEEGKWIGLPLVQEHEAPQSSVAPEELPAKEFWAQYLRSNTLTPLLAGSDTPFHLVDCINIPSGYVEVPVKLNDKGNPDLADPCTMVAGVIGTYASSSGDKGEDDVTVDTVQPVIGWWMFLNRETLRPQVWDYDS